MPSLPPRSQLTPRAPQQSPLRQRATGGKIRPLVYAIGVAGIVVSGAFIGAYVKTDRQREAAKNNRQALLQLPAEGSSAQAQTSAPPITYADADAVYSKSLDMLQSRRAQLIAQKVGFETKLRDFRESQIRKAEEERQRKEFGMKR